MNGETHGGWVEFDELRVSSSNEDGTSTDPNRPPDRPSSPAVISPQMSEMIADPSKLGRPTRTAVGAKTAADDRPGHKNGRILASIFPENTACAWLVPPRYNPYSMPAALSEEEIRLLPEDYVTALELIVNDYRFRSFSTLYSRLIAIWMTFSLVLLLAVLFSSPQGGMPVLIFCFAWCAFVLLGILACCVLRKQIRIGLRHCVQSANKILVKHNILAGIEDRGQLSCHKVIIHLLFFRVSDCLPDIERQIRIKSSGGAVIFGGGEAPPPPEDVHEKAKQLILKYSQGYVKDTCRNRILFPNRPTQGVSEYAPKHCEKRYCLCQYVDKQHFNRRPKKWYEHCV